MKSIARRLRRFRESPDIFRRRVRRRTARAALGRTFSQGGGLCEARGLLKKRQNRELRPVRLPPAHLIRRPDRNAFEANEIGAMKAWPLLR